jgi:hypothetical protein
MLDCGHHLLFIEGLHFRGAQVICETCDRNGPFYMGPFPTYGEGRGNNGMEGKSNASESD